ncbi:MAG: F0F1 ATP synthase subunit B [Kiloniellales bacterium]
MLEDPTFWVAVAFIAFVVLAARPVSRALFGALDARAERIRAEIEQAQALREEAQKTLAEYKRKQRDAVKEAEEILDHAKIEAKRLREWAERDLGAALKRREQAALEKIAQAETQALQEVRDRAIEVALAATARLISENLGKERSERLIDESIRELSGKLH